ncbi:MAG: hypothetical protein IJU04_06950 [Ruminococcus sp.]|nr:hypothetical protein [Ruminococcus sp.]
MDYYDSKDFNTMQEEAIKRVQEMQRRSRNLVNGSSSPPDNTKNQAKPVPDNSKSPIDDLLGSLLGGKTSDNDSSSALFNIGSIKIDEEKALIALMIYILFKNGSDVKLLLGLGYLLI